METHVFVYPKTDRESWGDSYDEGARGTCAPKRKCWQSCDYIVIIVQNIQNSPNDKKHPSLDSSPTPSRHVPDHPVNGSLIDDIPFLR